MGPAGRLNIERREGSADQHYCFRTNDRQLASDPHGVGVPVCSGPGRCPVGASHQRSARNDVQRRWAGRKREPPGVTPAGVTPGPGYVKVPCPQEIEPIEGPLSLAERHVRDAA